MHDRHDAHRANKCKQRDHHDGQVQPCLGLLADAVEVRLRRHGDIRPVAGPALDCGCDVGGVDAVEEGGCDDGGDKAGEGGEEGEERVEGGVVAELWWVSGWFGRMVDKGYVQLESSRRGGRP